MPVGRVLDVLGMVIQPNSFPFASLVLTPASDDAVFVANVWAVQQAIFVVLYDFDRLRKGLLLSAQNFPFEAAPRPPPRCDDPPKRRLTRIGHALPFARRTNVLRAILHLHLLIRPAVPDRKADGEGGERREQQSQAELQPRAAGGRIGRWAGHRSGRFRGE